MDGTPLELSALICNKTSCDDVKLYFSSRTLTRTKVRSLSNVFGICHSKTPVASLNYSNFDQYDKFAVIKCHLMAMEKRTMVDNSYSVENRRE